MAKAKSAARAKSKIMMLDGKFYKVTPISKKKSKSEVMGGFYTTKRSGQ